MKSRIYYARTYRHLSFDATGSLIFLMGFVLPMTILIFLFYDEMALLMCRIVMWFLEKTGIEDLGLKAGEFIPWLGPAWYVRTKAELPEQTLVVKNIAVCLAAVFILSRNPMRGKPLSIYILINLVIHMMSCVFFLLGSDVFPYTSDDYAELYVAQEIGIWITFLILSGCVEGTLGRGKVIFRILAVLTIMAYSFVFGTVRYALFLWLIGRYSLLYMPVMFFTLGPFFDFLYFVMIYSLSAGRMMKKNDGVGRNRWEWA